MCTRYLSFSFYSAENYGARAVNKIDDAVIIDLLDNASLYGELTPSTPETGQMKSRFIECVRWNFLYLAIYQDGP